MAVTIHIVNVSLFWVDSLGNVIHKGSKDTTFKDIMNAATQEYRVIPNLEGSGSTANSANYPTIADYLAAEAAADFAFAYMDQTQIITQQIV